MAFAKLFESPEGQIVAIKDDNEESGEPQIRFLFEPTGNGIKAEVSVGFSDSAQGYARRDHAFDTLSTEAVCSLRNEYQRQFQSLVS